MPVNDVATGKIAQIQEINNSSPEGSIDSICHHDAFSQVIGHVRHGHVCGYGLGPTPTMLWGASSSGGQQLDRVQAERMKETDAMIEEMKACIVEQDARIAELEGVLAKMEARMLEMSNKLMRREILGLDFEENKFQTILNASWLLLLIFLW